MSCATLSFKRVTRDTASSWLPGPWAFWKGFGLCLSCDWYYYQSRLLIKQPAVICQKPPQRSQVSETEITCALKNQLIKEIIRKPPCLGFGPNNKRDASLQSLEGSGRRNWQVKGPVSYTYVCQQDSLTEPIHRNKSNMSCSITPGDDLVSGEPCKHAGVARSESEGRRFGMEMRHLVRLVCQAFLDPGELKDPSASPNAESFNSLCPLGCWRISYQMHQNWAQSETFWISQSRVWSIFGTSDSYGFKRSHHIVVSSRHDAKPSAGQLTYVVCLSQITWCIETFTVWQLTLGPGWKGWWRKMQHIKHVTIGGQTSAILSGKLPDMHVSQAQLISLLAGLHKAIWCTLNSHSMKRATLAVNKSDKCPLLPSLNLQTQLYLGSSNWLAISNNAEIFLNLTSLLIHPELFECGLSMLWKLQQLETMKDVAWKWQSIYTSIAIISNRAMPSHRDSKGRPEWFDLLLNYSGMGNRAQLLIKDLGLTLEYSTETVVGFCGSILQHEVRSWGSSDRVCYTHFMQESVRKHLDVPPEGWVNHSPYNPD